MPPFETIIHVDRSQGESARGGEDIVLEYKALVGNRLGQLRRSPWANRSTSVTSEK